MEKTFHDGLTKVHWILAGLIFSIYLFLENSRIWYFSSQNISGNLKKLPDFSKYFQIPRDISRYFKKYWEEKYGLLHFLRFWRRLDLNLGFLVPSTSPLLVCINLPTISTFVNPVLPRIKMVKLVKRSRTICWVFFNNLTAWCKN